MSIFPSPQRKRISGYETLAVAVILLATFAARLYFIYTSPELKLTHDETGYHEMTLRYFEKGFLGYYSLKPSSYITPGYPVFLIMVYYVAGLLHTAPLATVRTVQVIISVGSVLLVYMLARKSGGPLAGAAAAILAAVYPSSFMANNRILTEVLYIFLILGYLYLLIIAFEKDRLWWHAASGAALAVAVLVRPAAAPFLVVAYAVRLFMTRDPRLLAGFLTAVITFSLVMTPWWVRNYLVFDKFIMFATQSGDPLLRGTDPYDVYDRYGPSIMKGVPRSERADLAVKRIKEGFKTEPWLWIKWFTVGKLSFLWAKPWGMYSQWARGLHLWVFVLLGWAGVLAGLFDRYLRWPALFVLFNTVLQLAFIPIERYTYPLMPIMAVMAATLIVKIVRKHLTLPV